MIYDVIIIGAGPAGLTAAIYAIRRAMKTLIIAKDIGGQANLAERVENYPAIFNIAGYELMQKMKEQADKLGVKFDLDEVVGIEKDGDLFIVKTIGGKEISKTVIIASGLIPRDLGVPGEEKFKGKGVSYCATCDAPFYKNKIAAVVGGGNSAVDAALLLSKFAKKVYLVHRRQGFRADEMLVCQLRETKNIELVLDSVISEIKGNEMVKSIIVSNVNSGDKREIKVDGVFVEIGYTTKIDWFKDMVKLNERNEIITDKECKTSTPGIFAAGDVTDIPFKQIVISAGEGAKAALSAYRYLHPMDKGNSEARAFDWGKCKK
jgi:thioredoxin reductase (NADPH)